MNSNTAMMPTMTFSIVTPSHFLTGARVPGADDEEQHHHSDINEVCHDFVLNTFRVLGQLLLDTSIHFPPGTILALRPLGVIKISGEVVKMLLKLPA